MHIKSRNKMSWCAVGLLHFPFESKNQFPSQKGITKRFTHFTCFWLRNTLWIILYEGSRICTRNCSSKMLSANYWNWRIKLKLSTCATSISDSNCVNIDKWRVTSFLISSTNRRNAIFLIHYQAKSIIKTLKWWHKMHCMHKLGD